MLASWLPVIVLTLVIFVLSSRPYTTYFSELEGSSHRLFRQYLQYPAHLVEYAVLALLWMRALLRHCGRRRRVAWLTLGAVVFTALVDESIQRFVPTRSFALRDLCMDSAGGLVAFALSGWIFPLTGKRS